MSLFMFKQKYGDILAKKPLAVQEAARAYIASEAQRTEFLNSLAPEMRKAFEAVIAAEDALKAALAKVEEINERTAAHVVAPDTFNYELAKVHEVVIDEEAEAREQAARVQAEIETGEARTRAELAPYKRIFGN